MNRTILVSVVSAVVASTVTGLVVWRVLSKRLDKMHDDLETTDSLVMRLSSKIDGATGDILKLQMDVATNDQMLDEVTKAIGALRR